MSEEKPIRVMIVDDQPVVRQGLATFLLAFKDLELVGEASGGTQALALAENKTADVVLMDLVMPEMGGVEATRSLLERFPHLRIIILTSFKEDDLVTEALKVGAAGYLLKNATANELAEAIRKAAQGYPVLAPEAAQSLIRHSMKRDNPAEKMTDRENEILQLMTDGLTNPEIGKALFISRSTVKFHVSNILAKLGASSRAEAVAMAVKRGLVSVEDKEAGRGT